MLGGVEVDAHRGSINDREGAAFHGPQYSTTALAVERERAVAAAEVEEEDALDERLNRDVEQQDDDGDDDRADDAADRGTDDGGDDRRSTIMIRKTQTITPNTFQPWP